MPTVTLSKKALEQLIGKKLSLEQLKERMSYLGTDLESVEGDNITIEIFPNRPDMLSEQGFGRALASFIGLKPGLREYKVKPSGWKVIVDKNVTMRPYTVCAVVKHLKFNDEGIREIVQLQEKLAVTLGRNRKKAAYGIYPLKGIKFPVTYKAEDPTKVRFRPLEYPATILASEVPEKHPKGKAYKHLTEGWKKYPFFFDADGKVLSMLPFTNSHDTGKVDESTKEVFIECSGTDFNTCAIALAIITTALADGGGEIYSLEMKYPEKTFTTPDFTPKSRELNLKYVNRILGLTLKETEVKTLLERMGFAYKNKKVFVPVYRADILHQADFVEDIAIAYGYENFKAVMPKLATVAAEDPFEKFKKKLAYLLVGLSCQEVSTYHLANKETITKAMQLEDKKENYISLANSCSEEYHVLRNQLTASLLQVLKENKHQEYPQRIFEMGRIFVQNKTAETGTEEKTMLAVAIADPTATYTTIRQVIDYLLRMLDLDLSCEIKEALHPSYIQGRAGKIIVSKRELGILGEITPEVLANFSLETPVVCFEINLDILFELVGGEEK